MCLPTFFLITCTIIIIMLKFSCYFYYCRLLKPVSLSFRYKSYLPCMTFYLAHMESYTSDQNAEMVNS
jgi:hypothetical protein